MSTNEGQTITGGADKKIYSTGAGDESVGARRRHAAVRAASVLFAHVGEPISTDRNYEPSVYDVIVLAEWILSGTIDRDVEEALDEEDEDDDAC